MIDENINEKREKEIVRKTTIKTVIITVVITVLILSLPLILIFSLVSPYGVWMWIVNGPFVIGEVPKFAVMGKTHEEIVCNNDIYYSQEYYDGFLLEDPDALEDLSVYDEYDNDGNIIGRYYMNRSSLESKGRGGLDFELYIHVTFENDIAVKVRAAEKKIRGDTFNRYYEFEDIDVVFDDWFTSYLYLGFIY